ncbi:MAG: A24 family peptidase [Ornithinimicrobium sp.]
MSTVIWVVGVITGTLGGMRVRGWLNTLAYRRPDEEQMPKPGSRWWVPVAALLICAAVGWRLVLLPSGSGTTLAGPGSFVDTEQIIVLVVLIVAGWACLALAAVDLDVHRLPDRITGPTLLWLIGGLGVASLAGAGWSPWLRMLLCAVLSGAFYLLLSLVSLTRGSSALGLGDVKLAVVLGAALGWFGVQSAIIGLYAAFLIGGLWAALLLIARRVKLQGHLAFGPAMMLGALCGVLLPPDSIGAMF